MRWVRWILLALCSLMLGLHAATAVQALLAGELLHLVINSGFTLLYAVLVRGFCMDLRR